METNKIFNDDVQIDKTTCTLGLDEMVNKFYLVDSSTEKTRKRSDITFSSDFSLIMPIAVELFNFDFSSIMLKSGEVLTPKKEFHITIINRGEYQEIIEDSIAIEEQFNSTVGENEQIGSLRYALQDIVKYTNWNCKLLSNFYKAKDKSSDLTTLVQKVAIDDIDGFYSKIENLLSYVLTYIARHEETPPELAKQAELLRKRLQNCTERPWPHVTVLTTDPNGEDAIALTQESIEYEDCGIEISSLH